MSEKHGGGSAHPIMARDFLLDPGMTLRDYFAAQALMGIIASHSGPDVMLPTTAMASMCAYDFADAMLAEREKGKGKS